MPGSVDALLQETVEGPPQHLSQILDSAQEDVTAHGVLIALDQPANKGGNGALADAALAAHEADPEAAPSAAADHAAQPLDLLRSADEELGRYALSRSERA